MRSARHARDRRNLACSMTTTGYSRHEKEQLMEPVDGETAAPETEPTEEEIQEKAFELIATMLLTDLITDNIRDNE